MAEFKLLRFKHTWHGEWTPGAIYNPDNMVSYGSKVYVCLVSHTAASDFYDDLNFYNGDIPPLLVPRWELVTEGMTWLKDWTSDTYYKIGDIVKLGGTIYKCIEGHTSYSKYVTIDGAQVVDINNPTGEKGFATTDYVYWTTQLTSNNWLSTWAPTTYYKLNDYVIYGGITYKCIQSHLSSGSTESGLEANQSQWTVVNLSDDWKGDWTISTKYIVNDIVRYNGFVYRCITNHVSETTETSGLTADLSNWTELHKSTEYRGTWEPTTIYIVNDVVKYGSYVWKANTFHTSSTLFDSDKWDIFTPGQEFDVLWNNATIYQEGDVVGYGGDIYYAKILNNNSVPSTDTAAWEPLLRSSKFIGQWDSLTDYKTGDVVAQGGNIYLALQDNFAKRPDLINDGSSTNSEYWDLAVPGISWKGIWANEITYSTGDVVTWGPNAYKCIDAHLSAPTNRPDDDSNGLYWQAVVIGNSYARLSEVGDIRTFGSTSDSTVDYKRLAVGNLGDALTVNTSDEVSWDKLWNSSNVYHVALNGKDVPTGGTSPQNPWRTIRYAAEHVPANSTIFVKTGVYEEVLPIRVPVRVAIVGDELRSAVVKPANNIYSQGYVALVAEGVRYIKDLIEHIVLQNEIGTTDELAPAYGTKLYGEVPQNYDATIGTPSSVSSAESLFGDFISRVETSGGVSLSGSNTATIDTDILNTIEAIENNKEFLKNEATIYIENFFTDSTVTDLRDTWSIDLDRAIEAVIADLQYPGNYNVISQADFFVNASDGATNKIQNMFLLRDATGLRNMTLIGLDGELTDMNLYGTRRVTAGAYASLDPGWGPTHEAVWVGTRSPYVQNVTTFGSKCIGMKVDGDIHAGGNQTIVANDFTQILSDGIGMWCNGTGRAELVSVFVYYNHIGYLCTNGGKIRGTNGNCSYGTYGAVSEGYNVGETPITGTINNRYYDATVAQAFSDDQFGIQKLFFTNAGVEYTSGTFSISGSGGSASLVMDEFRDGGVYEVRIANLGDSSAEGGGGYVFTTNVSQGGDSETIIISGSDENEAATYRGMRVVIPGGTGAGQYGYVAEYDDVGKTIYVGKESKPAVGATQSFSVGNILQVSSTAHLSVDDPVVFTGTKFGNIQDNTIYYVRTIEGPTTLTLSASEGGSVYFLINATGTMTMHSVGWDHFVEGTPILTALDTTTNYAIEPRVTFTDPGFTTGTATLPNETWVSLASSDDNWVAITASDAAAYSSDGNSWNSVTLPVDTTWTKVRYGGGYFIAVASTGEAAKSIDGSSWSSITMPTSDAWSDIAYGNGTWVVIATGTDVVAYSTDLTSWSTTTMTTNTDWVSIVYGANKFVAVANTGEVAYSTNGSSWTEDTLSSTMTSLAYGNNRFVAISTGTATTDVAISFNGIDWTYGSIEEGDWKSITYGQGLFVAIQNNSDTLATSNTGIEWDTQTVSSGNWVDVSFANISKPGKFLVISSGTSGFLISSGVKAQARVVVVAGRISEIRLWEPGSGYTSAPVMTITDPNNSSEVTTVIRIGNGVIANPTISNRGTGYETTSTRVTISGNGYKDEYHLGSFIVCDGVTRLPGPGDNLTIAGINDYVYKVLSHEILEGSLGDYRLRINIAKDLGREETPEHGTPIEIRQLYSQVRLTGHDFLEIGLGGFYETNYPDTLNPNGTIVSPENEVLEKGGGRVFYTSTDQEGNFRVGELFAVEQATGTVTLNAQFFELQGLEELRLGGVTVGGTGVVVREFSTDSTFTADSNNIVPTQRAIKAYIQRRVSGGGADAVTSAVVAGLVQVGPTSMGTTSGDTLIFDELVNFKGGVDGTYLAQTYFMGMK